jgi:DNA-binding beta-propeller fold protein YncE
VGLAGCSARGSITAPFILSSNQAIVLTSDFATGGVSVIDLDTRQVAANVATVHSDATLRFHDGLIYVINRFGQDNIQIIDPGKHYATLRQFSTGNGSNPQDIAFATSRKAYVSRYGSADLEVVDPRSGFQLSTISLAAFADGDGLPEMARMAMVGQYLFVACQRLTNFAASNPSMVVVINVITDAIVDVDPGAPGVQAITLIGRNPVTELVYDAVTHSLLVGCAGAYGVMDGGIERIDAFTLQDLGVVISETALGGDIGDIAWNGPDHSYAIVSDASFNASVVSWSATTGAMLAPVYAPGGFSLPDCEVDARGELYVCDNRFTAAGVRVFRTGVDTLIAGPLDTGLPPSQIAFR